jgi:hypothetical protein
MLAHLRTEAYPVYRRSLFPPGRWSHEPGFDVEANRRLIEETKKLVGGGLDDDGKRPG